MRVSWCAWVVPVMLAMTVDARAAGRAACRDGDRGRLIRYERVASYPTAAAAAAYFEEWIAFYQDYYRFPAELPERFTHGFDSYKVTYCTVDAVRPGERTARPTVASGMVSVPRAGGPLPTVVYQRGTAVSYYDAPSNPHIAGALSERGESFEGPPATAAFAGNGFIWIAADYLGFGDSTVPRHPYFHAETEASAAADLMGASRHVLADLRARQSGELFIFGFSQGSHAALALHRALQEANVEVTGTATVGSIFDVETWFLSGFTNQTTITLPLYMAYLLLAYDDIYDVYQRKTDVFRQPYASTVDELFDMQHFWDDILAAMAPTAQALLTRSYTLKLADPREPMRVRLRQNAVDRWRPEAPLRVYHSTADEEAAYADMLASVERLRRAGADVTVRTLTGFDHINSWIQVMPRAVTWFQSRR